MKTDSKGSVITIGNFDGFHLGHKKIVDCLKTVASKRRLTSILLSFHPHPKIFFNQDVALINTYEQRRETLLQQAVDAVEFIEFKTVASLTPEAFVKQLIDGYGLKLLVIGSDFRFGKGRKGDREHLRVLSKKIDFQIVEVKPATVAGEKVSSSKIREMLSKGEIKKANRLLGKSYFIDGTVEKGYGIGKKLGYPTINLNTQNKILPVGVFHTQGEIEGKTYEAATYIGTRPTFSGGAKKIETYILGFNRIIYGKFVRLYFKSKIRDDIKFKSSVALKRQISRDIASLTFDKEVHF